MRRASLTNYRSWFRNHLGDSFKNALIVKGWSYFSGNAPGFGACSSFMKVDKIIEDGIRNLVLELFAVFAFLLPRGPESDPLRIETSNRIAVFAISIIGIAIGLLYKRKWAVMYFCLGSLLAASWLFFESIWFVPFPFNLCYMILAIVFVGSTIDFIRSWSLFSWRGRWFF